MTQLFERASPATRPTYMLIFRPEPGVDPILALRALLKIALRRFGMRCVSARENDSVEKGNSEFRAHQRESADAALHPEPERQLP